jgi:hypothetical protein
MHAGLYTVEEKKEGMFLAIEPGAFGSQQDAVWLFCGKHSFFLKDIFSLECTLTWICFIFKIDLLLIFRHVFFYK